MNYAGRTVLSFLSFNIGWWAAALGARHELPWIGPALMPVWVGLHLYFSPVAKGDSLFFIILGLLGFAVDSLLIKLRLFSIVPAQDFAPMWMVIMWILFGQTFES